MIGFRRFKTITVFYILFALLTLATGVFDFLFYRIPNVLTAAIGCLYVFMAICFAPTKEILFALSVSSATLCACYIFYVFRWLGAGDVKFIFVTSLWASHVNVGAFFLGICFAGAALALLYLIFTVHVDRLRLLLTVFLDKKLANIAFFKRYSDAPFIYTTTTSIRKTQIPYGVAITAGSLIITYLQLSSY